MRKEMPQKGAFESPNSPRGGSGWESNPPGPVLHNPSDGFEDRARHRPRTTPTYNIHPNTGFVKRATLHSLRTGI